MHGYYTKERGMGELSSVYMGIISRREGWGNCLVSTWVLYQGERDGGTV